MHEVFDGDLFQPRVVVDHIEQRIDDLAQIMGRDIGRHAHRNPTRTVDQQVGQCRGQNIRLLQRIVKVVMPINGILVKVGEHQRADLRQARLGITHGRRAVAIDRAKVALAVDQGIAQAEILRHTHHRVIDRHIAVGMIFTQHFTDDTCTFAVRLVVGQVEVVGHRIEDTAVDRLQPIAHIGQGARDDDAHRIVKIRSLHLIDNVCRAYTADIEIGRAQGGIAIAIGTKAIGAGTIGIGWAIGRRIRHAILASFTENRG